MRHERRLSALSFEDSLPGNRDRLRNVLDGLGERHPHGGGDASITESLWVETDLVGGSIHSTWAQSTLARNTRSQLIQLKEERESPSGSHPNSQEERLQWPTERIIQRVWVYFMVHSMGVSCSGVAILKVILADVKQAATLTFVFSLIQSVNSAVDFILHPIRAQYSDKHGRKPVLYTSLLSFLLSSLGLIVFPTVVTVITASILKNVFSTFTLTSINVMADVLPSKPHVLSAKLARTAVLNAVAGLLGFGTGLCILFTGVDVRLAFIFTAACNVLCLCLVWGMPETLRTNESDSQATTAEFTAQLDTLLSDAPRSDTDVQLTLVDSQEECKRKNFTFSEASSPKEQHKGGAVMLCSESVGVESSASKTDEQRLQLNPFVELRDQLRLIQSDERLKWLMYATCLTDISNAGGKGVMLAYTVQKFGFNSFDIGLFVFLGGLAGGISSLTSGRLNKLVGSPKLMTISVAVSSIYLVGAAMWQSRIFFYAWIFINLPLGFQFGLAKNSFIISLVPSKLQARISGGFVAIGAITTILFANPWAVFFWYLSSGRAPIRFPGAVLVCMAAIRASSIFCLRRTPMWDPTTANRKFRKPKKNQVRD